MMESKDIEQFVISPTWREMLVELVISEQLDPWNMDIGKIAEGYISKIKKAKELDLHIPSNVMLAAAILLRLKSEALKLEEEQTVEEERYIGEGEVGEIPMLHIRYRLPQKRPITLPDLISALEEVMEIERKRKEREAERKIKPIEIKIPKFNIEREIEAVFKAAKRIKNREGWLTFSSLLKARRAKDIEEKIQAFLPLLYLTQDGKLDILQEKLFDEIFIRVLTCASGKSHIL